MGLLDLFKRDDRGAPAAGAAAAAGAAGEQAELARTRAKRRLIGAVVLLGVGVIAFPLLFETQPRPIPVNIPIEIPSREHSAPLPLPAAKPVAPKPTASGPSGQVVSEAPRDAVPPVPAPVQTPVAQAPVVQAPAPKVAAAKVEPAPAPAPKAVLDPPKRELVKPVTEAPGRFVVQVGAFSEASAVRDARAKVEKLGLATYTQVVDTSSGQRTRVRLGPFATREQADQAAGKVKSAGLPASVLAL